MNANNLEMAVLQLMLDASLLMLLVHHIVVIMRHVISMLEMARFAAEALLELDPVTIDNAVIIPLPPPLQSAINS